MSKMGEIRQFTHAAAPPQRGTAGDPEPAPRVTVLCPGAWSVRNVVHGGVSARLRSAGCAVHLLIAEAWLAASLGPEEAWSPLGRPPVVRRVRGKPLLETMLCASFARHHGLTSHGVFRRWRRAQELPWERARNVVVETWAAVGCAAPLLRYQTSALERLTRYSWDLRAIRAELACLRPALVVSTACIAGLEVPYLLAARDLGIPTLGCILSFDNLTSRGVLPVFDQYAVWNERMRDEVLALYPDRKPDAVHITGTPQFDFHVQPAFRLGRAETLAEFGFGPEERYLVYGANSREFTPSEPALVAAFARACASEPGLQSHRIVVRLHPLDDPARWASIRSGHPRIMLQRPWSSLDGAFRGAEQARLIGTLLHADTCINFASTIALDAAVLDRPVVWVAFAGGGSPAETRFSREVYAADHLRPIVASGGVRLAQSIDELVTAVSAYVRDSSLDRAARRQLVATAVGAVDGRAAERVAALIATLASGRVASAGREAHP
jgi:hypothetical protein